MVFCNYIRNLLNFDVLCWTLRQLLDTRGQLPWVPINGSPEKTPKRNNTNLLSGKMDLVDLCRSQYSHSRSSQNAQIQALPKAIPLKSDPSAVDLDRLNSKPVTWIFVGMNRMIIIRVWHILNSIMLIVKISFVTTYVHFLWVTIGKILLSFWVNNEENDHSVCKSVLMFTGLELCLAIGRATSVVWNPRVRFS